MCEALGWISSTAKKKDKDVNLAHGVGGWEVQEPGVGIGWSSDEGLPDT
jgi:hypothetical protein